MIRADIDIELNLTGPFITKGSAPGPWGLDEVLARNADGKYFLPGAHIAGKLRQAWEELADLINKTPASAKTSASTKTPNTEAIDRLLGAKAYGDERTARTGQLLFSDLELHGRQHDSDAMRYRIRIDPERGAVEDRAQLMLEYPFASGEPICFTGQISFLASDEAEAERIFGQVQTGFRWITQLGAFRSEGFGRLDSVDMVWQQRAPAEEENVLPSGATALGLSIKPLAPFCVDAVTPSDNLFYSSEIISGATILGCLHNMLGPKPQRSHADEFAKLREHFPCLRVRHAFPAAECMKRPVTVPLSVVKAAGAHHDVALIREPCLIGDAAPFFSPDWKDAGPRDKFGWPSLERELRVRTRIDADKLRARDEELFSYDMVRPGGHCWLSHIDLSDVPEQDRPEVAKQLARLLSLDLMGIGKNKTIAKADLLRAGQITPSMPVAQTGQRLSEDELVCITLQTDALLLAPSDKLNESAGKQALLDAYRESWKELSAALKLEYFYAQQHLRGGEYMARRYRRWGNNGQDYYPWILTRPGSVFVFSVTDQTQAEADLNNWVERGLPLGKTIRDAYNIEGEEKDWWKTCPWVPHNGYGEIAVNLDIHETWRPENIKTFNAVEEVSE